MQDLHDENLILAYVEGEMPAAQRHEFKLAMMKDARLYRLVEQLSADCEALKSLPAEPAPEYLMEHVQQYFERELLLGPQSMTDAPAEPARRMTFHRVAAFGAMAAMILLGAGLIYKTMIVETGEDQMSDRQLAVQSPDMLDVLKVQSQVESAAPNPKLRRAVARELTEENSAVSKDGNEIKPLDAARLAGAMADDQIDGISSGLLAQSKTIGNEQADHISSTATAMKSVLLPTMPDQLPLASESEAMFADVSADEKKIKIAAAKVDKPKPINLSNPARSMTFALTTNELPDMDTAALAASAEKAKNTTRGAAALARRTPSRSRRVHRLWAPSSIAMAVTTSNADATLTRLIDWAEQNEATVRFNRRKESSAPSNSLLPDLGKEQRRLQMRIKGSQLTGLMSHMTHGSTSSQLVRQPRKQLSVRQLSRIRDLSDYIAQEVPITPSSLRLRDKQLLTLDIILRLPPTPLEVEDRK